MKNIIFYIFCISVFITSCDSMQQAVSTPVANQKTKDARGTDMLLGHCSRSCLHEAPYKDWFEKNYADYTIDSVNAALVKPLIAKKNILVFMGTWCGDSRREVPRLIKILDYCGVPDDHLSLVMLDYQDGFYKQSPQHEEKSRNIFRVPCILVLNGDKEIGRIVESPRQSLEQDLLMILNKKDYQPNYEAGKWFFEKALSTSVEDLNKNMDEISGQLKPRLTNSAELGSIGHVLLDRKETGKAVFAYLINANLYPAAGTNISLAKAYLQNNEKEKAKAAVEKALQIDPNNEDAKKMMIQLE